ncbi:MAG: hypothetical protein ABL859_08165, partial [Methylotenera sp.]
MAVTETKAQQATTENGGTVAVGLAPEGAGSRVRQVIFRKRLAKAKAVHNPKTAAAGLPSRDGGCYLVTRVLPTAMFLNPVESLRTGQHTLSGFSNTNNPINLKWQFDHLRLIRREGI